MRPRVWHIPFLLAVAGTALWLLISGPLQLLGFDGGNVGVVLLMTTLWVSLWLISTLPEHRLSSTASPGEWQAWLGLAFLTVALIYFFSKLQLFAVPGTAMDNPDAARVGRNIVMLLIAWAILSSTMAARWKGVRSDERDLQIAARGETWARCSLAVFVIALAVTLAFTPADRLQWASPLLLANLLIIMLMASNLVETLVQALSYWRDRH
jgi:uncharacterized membrane protein YidH (DUF202 family)